MGGSSVFPAATSRQLTRPSGARTPEAVKHFRDCVIQPGDHSRVDPTVMAV